MRLELSDGAFLHYEVHGERGPWMLLCNGALSSTLGWAEVVPLLAEQRRVLLCDFRDQGQSSMRDPGYEASAQVPDLVELLDHVGAERADVVGVSYGAHVALCLAREHQRRMRRLVLSAVTPRTPVRLQEIGALWELLAARGDAEGFVRAMLPHVYSHGFHERHPDLLEERRRLVTAALDSGRLNAFERIVKSARQFDHTDDLGAIAVPTLLVCGTEDSLFPPQETFAMAERIPDAACLALPGVGHGLFVEAPRAFATAVLGFSSLPLPDPA